MLKKILFIVVVMLCLTILVSCSFSEVETDVPQNPDVTVDTEEPVIEEDDNKYDKKEKPVYVEEKKENNNRVIDISAGIEKVDFPEKFKYSWDLNSDGKKEIIEINVLKRSDDTGDTEVEVSIGNYCKIVEGCGAYLEKVYVCDMDTNDGILDVAVITSGMNGGPRIRIYKYNEDLTLYKFLNEGSWLDEPVVEDSQGLSYAVKCYFYINDDDSIILEERTPSMGMWSVYKTYYKDENGVYVEKVPDAYYILPDYMERMGSYKHFREGMCEEEYEMWMKGYILAQESYKNNGFAINKGEYFKLTFDDGNDALYAEKENGDAGWIYIDHRNNARKLHESYFAMAG